GAERAYLAQLARSALRRHEHARPDARRPRAERIDRAREPRALGARARLVGGQLAEARRRRELLGDRLDLEVLDADPPVGRERLDRIALHLEEEAVGLERLEGLEVR